MRASFSDLLWCLRAKSIFGFDRACVGVHEKRVNIKKAVIMAATIGQFFANCNVGFKKHSLLANHKH